MLNIAASSGECGLKASRAQRQNGWVAHAETMPRRRQVKPQHRRSVNFRRGEITYSSERPTAGHRVGTIGEAVKCFVKEETVDRPRRPSPRPRTDLLTHMRLISPIFSAPRSRPVLYRARQAYSRDIGGTSAGICGACPAAGHQTARSRRR